MGVSQTNSDKQQIYHHFDLNEIDSVLKPEENQPVEDDKSNSLGGITEEDEDEDDDNETEANNDVEEMEMEQICFSLITKEGSVYIFEAMNMKQRNFVVDSLNMVLSRLAFV